MYIEIKDRSSSNSLKTFSAPSEKNKLKNSQVFHLGMIFFSVT